MHACMKLYACTDACMHAYVHAGLAFSPEGSEVAVAQSDGVVHVYKTKEGGRRSICCRLPLGCTATCLTWAAERNSFLFIGLASGRVRIADVPANKLGTLHEAHRSDIHACMRACMHACMQVFACMRCGVLFMHACKCLLCLHACMDACMHPSSAVHALYIGCMHCSVCMRSCIHTCINSYACIHAI